MTKKYIIMNGLTSNISNIIDGKII